MPKRRRVLISGDKAEHEPHQTISYPLRPSHACRHEPGLLDRFGEFEFLFRL